MTTGDDHHGPLVHSAIILPLLKGHQELPTSYHNQMPSTFWDSLTCLYPHSPLLLWQAGVLTILGCALSSLQDLPQNPIFLSLHPLNPVQRSRSLLFQATCSRPPQLWPSLASFSPSHLGHEPSRSRGAGATRCLSSSRPVGGQQRCGPVTHQQGTRTGPWFHSKRRRPSQTSCSPSQPPPPPSPERIESGLQSDKEKKDKARGRDEGQRDCGLRGRAQRP